jgi:hypothetical protein
MSLKRFVRISSIFDEKIIKNKMISYIQAKMQDQDDTNKIIEGKMITKEKRYEIFGKVAGGAGSRTPEIYQRSSIEEHTKNLCYKTNMRINLMTNKLTQIAKPNMHDDGFNYSEDFDGCQVKNDKTIYINLKCIVGKGGSQTRSLREVYWFIRGQLEILKNGDDKKIYFANILDGDEAYSVMSKFTFLTNMYKNDDILKRIYIGNLKDYIKWYQDL